jgi:transcriptional regulator with XRE-family HTH domain
MGRTWREIRGERALNEEHVEAYRRLLDAEVRLNDLRRRRGLSQAEVAHALEVSQPNISRIEQEDDVYLSTLARYVAALGGRLEVNAVFPEETIALLAGPDAPPVEGATGPD